MKIQEEIRGTSKQYFFSLTYLLIRSRFRRPPKQENSTYTVGSAHLSNMTPKRRGLATRLLGQFREIAELNDVDIMAGDFNSSTYRERGKAGGELHRRNIGKDVADGLGSNVRPDGGLKGLLRLHSTKECTELASRKAWKLST